MDVYYRIEGPFLGNWEAISLLAPHSSRLVLGMSLEVDIVGNVGSIRMKLVGICLLVGLVVDLDTHCPVVSTGSWRSWQVLAYFGGADRPRDCP